MNRKNTLKELKNANFKIWTIALAVNIIAGAKENI